MMWGLLIPRSHDFCFVYVFFIKQVSFKQFEIKLLQDWRRHLKFLSKPKAQDFCHKIKREGK